MKKVSIDQLLQDPVLQQEFCASLIQGEVAVIPTDTLYGFAVSAASAAAVEKVYRIKSRDSRKPLILFLDSSEKLAQLGIRPDSRQQAILDQNWPGALTAIFARPDNEKIPAFTFPTLGIRVPAHARLLQLLQLFPGLLLTTSANRSGLPSDVDPQKIAAEFADEVAWLIEDGCLSPSSPSTVIDLSVEPYRILRQGAVEPKL